MREYLNLFENTIQTEEDIKKVFKELKREYNASISSIFDIDSDGINLRGDFVLNDTNSDVDINMPKLPVQFSRCNSNFVVKGAGLKTLEGFPETVAGQCNIANNIELDSLMYGPKYVGSFIIYRTNVKDFQYGPEVTGLLKAILLDNLTSLKGLPKELRSCDIHDCPNLSLWETRYILFSKFQNKHFGKIETFDKYNVDTDRINRFLQLSDSEKKNELLPILEEEFRKDR